MTSLVVVVCLAGCGARTELAGTGESSPDASADGAVAAPDGSADCTFDPSLMGNEITEADAVRMCDCIAKFRGSTDTILCSNGYSEQSPISSCVPRWSGHIVCLPVEQYVECEKSFYANLCDNLLHHAESCECHVGGNPICGKCN